MTQQEKREQKLNKVLTLINKMLGIETDKEKKQDLINRLNTIGFLYSVDRMNDMQVLTKLCFVANELGIKENSILILLNDKGGIFDEDK